MNKKEDRKNKEKMEEKKSIIVHYGKGLKRKDKILPMSRFEYTESARKKIGSFSLIERVILVQGPC